MIKSTPNFLYITASVCQVVTHEFKPRFLSRFSIDTCDPVNNPHHTSLLTLHNHGSCVVVLSPGCELYPITQFQPQQTDFEPLGIIPWLSVSLSSPKLIPEIPSAILDGLASFQGITRGTCRLLPIQVFDITLAWLPFLDTAVICQR